MTLLTNILEIIMWLFTENSPKVEKPEITQVPLNRDTSSLFGKTLFECLLDLILYMMITVKK